MLSNTTDAFFSLSSLKNTVHYDENLPTERNLTGQLEIDFSVLQQKCVVGNNGQ